MNFERIYNVMTVEEVPEYYQYVSDSQDIEEYLNSLGIEHKIDEFGLLFVDSENGEINHILGCEQSIPCLHYPLTQLFKGK